MIQRLAWIIALTVALVAAAFGQDANIVREILVRGNRRVTKEAITSTLTTKVGSLYSQEKLDADKQALQDMGFFSTVDVRGVPIESGNNWQVLVTVEEFPEIKEIRVTGNSVVPTADILKQITPGLQPGKVFNSREAPPTARAIQKLYSERGYDAQILEFAPLAASPGTLSITILETKIGTVSVQGNKTTKDWVLRRLVKTRTGDVYSLPKWSSDIRRLYNTQWFDTVVPTADYSQELGRVNLGIDLKEARTGSFNVGVQVDPRSSFAGIIRLSENNLGGTGQGVDLNFLQATSGGGPSVDLSYTNPFFNRTDTAFRASIFSRVVYRFQNGLFGTSGTNFTAADQYFERRTGGSLGFTRPINDTTSVNTGVRLENVKTEGLSLIDNAGTPNDPTDDKPRTNFIQQDGLVTVGTLGGTRDRRDVAVNSSRGDYSSVTIEPGYSNITKVGGITSHTNILGPNYFLRGNFEIRKYYTNQKSRGLDLKAPRRVLALRARYGTITGNVPFFEQYFAGGVDTVRGYAEDRFWGKNTLLTSAELRIPLDPNFSIIGFTDYGGAWGGYGTVNNYTQTNTFKMHLGFGPGISFNVGAFGNIQLYLGFDENGKSRTHFLIGNSF